MKSHNVEVLSVEDEDQRKYKYTFLNELDSAFRNKESLKAKAHRHRKEYSHKSEVSRATNLTCIMDETQKQ